METAIKPGSSISDSEYILNTFLDMGKMGQAWSLNHPLTP